MQRIDIIGQNGNDGDHYCDHYCDHEYTILLRSINIKQCRLCYHKVTWKLKEGQKPLITSSKDRMV